MGGFSQGSLITKALDLVPSVKVQYSVWGVACHGWDDPTDFRYRTNSIPISSAASQVKYASSVHYLPLLHHQLRIEHLADGQMEMEPCSTY